MQNSEKSRLFLGMNQLQQWVIGVFSIYEIFAVYKLRPSLIQSAEPTSALTYVLLHSGDFNNAFFVSLIVDRIFLLNKFINLSSEQAKYIASIFTVLLFISIEFDDPQDIPAAILGAFFYLLSKHSD